MLSIYQEVPKRVGMAFAFLIAIACSCRLLVRIRYCKHEHAPQLDLRFDKTLVVVDSVDFPEFQPREKPTSDQVNPTFSGCVSVGAPASSHIPPGGYIVMVVMEDLNPVNGTVLRGTIVMVVIEDVDVEIDFNQATNKVTTAAISPTATTEISVTKPLQMIARPAAVSVHLTASTRVPAMIEQPPTPLLKINTSNAKTCKQPMTPYMSALTTSSTWLQHLANVREATRAVRKAASAYNANTPSTARFNQYTGQDSHLFHLQSVCAKVSSINQQGPALTTIIEQCEPRLPTQNPFQDIPAAQNHEYIKTAAHASIEVATIVAAQSTIPLRTRSQLTSAKTTPSSTSNVEREQLKIIHAPESSVRVVGLPRQKMTVHERIRQYEIITTRNSVAVSSVNHRTSVNVVTTQGIAASTQKTLIFGEAADDRELTTTTIPQSGMGAADAAVFVRQLRRRILLRGRTVQPHTNSSLEAALDVLRRVDLDAMATASATIRRLTSDSRECCARCVEVPASLLIYNSLVRMSSQSPDPVMLHNLLLSLGNLAKYRRWKLRTLQPATRFKRFGARSKLDVRLIEVLGEVLLVLSDDLQPGQAHSWSLFTTTAEALWDIVMLVQFDAAQNTRPMSWSGTHQRLIGLRDRLLVKEKLELQQRVLAVVTESGGASSRSPDRERCVQYLTRAAAILARIAELMRA